MGKKWKDILCLLMLSLLFLFPVLVKSDVDFEYCDSLEEALELSSGIEDCNVFINNKDKTKGYLIVGSKYNDILPEIAKYTYDCTGGVVKTSEPKDGKHMFIGERGVCGIRYEVFVEYTLESKDGRNYLNLSKLGSDGIDLADVAVVEDTVSEVFNYFK